MMTTSKLWPWKNTDLPSSTGFSNKAMGNGVTEFE